MLPDMTRKYSRFEIEYTRDWNRRGATCLQVLEQAKRVREFANEASRLADSLVRQLEAEI